MSTKYKHIVILICYNNFEHIVQCFESIKNLPFDFFIIENYSNNSIAIQEYFKKEDLIGYVQFEENISNNAVDVIKNDYSELINSYEYITFSDCDLLPNNSVDLFNEIYKILEHNQVGVCGTSLLSDNLPNIPNSSWWTGHPISINFDYINMNTGIWFITIKQRNYHIVENVKFKDSTWCNSIREKKLIWAATKINKVKHLTWDLFYDGNEYYEFKKKSFKDIWNHNNFCNYKVIL